MSNLAPFVAATIRDRVVVEQQDEIAALERENRTLRQQLKHQERRMKEMNPIRSIQIMSPDGSNVYASEEINVESILEEETDVIPLFRGQPDVVFNHVQDFFLAEVHIDGSKSFSMADLIIVSERYVSCCLSQADYIHCRFVCGIGNPDFSVNFYMGSVSLEEYQHITGLSVDQLVPATMSAIHVKDGVERILDTRHVIGLFGTSMSGKLVFDSDTGCYCSSDFFFEHLDVPYIPRNPSDG